MPGRVKTRLAVRLGMEGAAAVYTMFVRLLLHRLPTITDCELHLDMPTDAFAGSQVSVRMQGQGNIGERMYFALEQALGENRPVAAIIGSDAPTLPDSAIANLLNIDADIALGPAEDGGYWGIAARRTHPKMFEGVRWSTAHALEDTEAACRAAGLSVVRGDLWFDVDEPEDLDRVAGLLEKCGSVIL